MNKIVAILASIGILLGATPTVANDISGSKGYHSPEGFKIRYISSLNKGERSDVIRRATEEDMNRLQAEIAADPAVLDELRSHHVILRNVIGARSSMSGTMIYYVK